MSLDVQRKRSHHVSLATHDSWIDEHGQKQQHTHWNTIVVWSTQAEAYGHYVIKGRQLYNSFASL